MNSKVNPVEIAFCFLISALFCDCFWLGIKEKVNTNKEIGKYSIEKTPIIIDEAKKNETENEQVKKMLAEFNRRMEKQMTKYAKELEKDEKLKEMLKKIKAAKAKHPHERRKAVQSITEINAKHLDELYQGDIKLNMEQAKFLINSIKPKKRKTNANISETLIRVKRGGAKNAENFPNNKWPLFVPYSFDRTISIEMQTNILIALSLWEDKTCLNMSKDNTASPRIQFTNITGKGCGAHVGMQKTDEYQEIDLEYPACYNIGKIAHEIGHALGFVHEHVRYDRDSYIWYFQENVDPANYYAFEKETKESTDNYQVPYDFGSVMHYNAKDFSINDEYTMLPKAEHYYSNTIGQRFGPSFHDYMVMNKHYCGLELLPDGSSINTESCYVTTTCDNNGFQNPKACFDCICPSGYVGTKCENVDTVGYAPVGVRNTCNGNVLFPTFDWQDLHGKIGSDSLESDFDYAYCHWQIFANIGDTIYIQVLSVGDACSDGCFWGNTEIRTEANRAVTGVRLCCSSDLGPTGQLHITATNGYAMISLYSYYNIQRFHIRFRQQ